MKYLEEIQAGETFIIEDKTYLVTIDFKKNGDRLCYCLSTGSPKWLEAKSVVNINPLFYLDKDNNIIPLKTITKQDVVG